MQKDTLMPSIYNLDSSIEIPKKIYDQVVNKLTYLIKAWNDLREIITVNENTMDKLCPPEESLNPNCVKEIMLLLKREAEKYDKFSIERINDMLSRCKSNYNAVACYKDRKIYICPERIWKHNNPEDVFKFVLIHELTHAYLDSPNHKHRSNKFPDYYKVIEESLCNAVAYYHISDRNKILDFLNSQPAEYQGYVFWLKQPKNYIPFILDLWQKNKVPILLYRKFELYEYFEYLYHIFKHPIYLYHFHLFPVFIKSNIPAHIIKDCIEEYMYSDNEEPLISLIGLSILESI